MLTSTSTNIFLTSKTNKYCKSIVYNFITATVLLNVNMLNFIIARKAFRITTKGFLNLLQLNSMRFKQYETANAHLITFKGC